MTIEIPAAIPKKCGNQHWRGKGGFVILMSTIRRVPTKTGFR